MNSHQACLRSLPKRSVRFSPTPRTLLKAFRAILFAAVCQCAASTIFAASMSGTVTASGLGVADISVDVYLWDPVNLVGELVAFEVTGADGSYTVGNLAAGTYRVNFRDNTGVFAPIYYVGAGDIFSATDIPLTAAQTVSGIDVALLPASSIGGTVTAEDGTTPLESISVTVFRSSGGGWEFVGGQTTEVDGTFVVGGLAAGAYRVEFIDALGFYAAEFYNDKPTLDLADTVNVPVSTDVTGINASLIFASSISGTVTGPSGAPLSEPILVSALVYSESSGAWLIVSSSSTDAAGNYTVSGLSAGTYRVEFSDFGGNYATEYYDDAADIASAADVVVGVSTTTSGIDASLSLAGYSSWAEGYNLNPATDGAPSADPDEDGFVNGSEYAFGTDPTLSTPALLYSARSGGDLVVTYVGKNVGVTYQAETTTDLKAGPWSDVLVQPTLDPNQDEVPFGYSRQILSIPSGGKLFLRVRASWN